MNREYDKKYEHPECNPNVQVTITPLPNAKTIAKLLGFEGYGIFKILEAQKQIDLEYLVTFECNDAYRTGEEKTEVLLIVYALMFGHNRVFEVEGYDDATVRFADVLLRAIGSRGKGTYIHNYLCRCGYYDDQK